MNQNLQHIGLGKALLKQQKYGRAIAVSRRFLAINPDSGEAQHTVEKAYER